MSKNITLLLIFFSTLTFGQDYKVFHTSVCYDMLSSFDKYESVIGNPFFENTLAKDTMFINDVRIINQKVRPSNLCNLYASLSTDKEDVVKCLDFFNSIEQEDVPEKFKGKYVDNIFSVMPQLQRALHKLVSANYQNYWIEQVYPMLKQEIDRYKFEEGLLDRIHTELAEMAGDNSLSEEYPKIYILDIDNAFSLNDETFCCTYVLLNEEIAKTSVPKDKGHNSILYVTRDRSSSYSNAIKSGASKASQIENVFATKHSIHFFNNGCKNSNSNRGHLFSLVNIIVSMLYLLNFKI